MHSDRSTRWHPRCAAAVDAPRESSTPTWRRGAKWRDADAAAHYWLAADMSAAGPVAAVQLEMMRRLVALGKVDMVTDLFSHRTRPSEVFTPLGLLGAEAIRLLARREHDWRALLGEVSTLVREDVHRRHLNWRPEYAAADTFVVAGLTAAGERTVR